MPKTENRAKRRPRPNTALAITDEFGAVDGAQRTVPHLAEHLADEGAA